MSLIEQFLRSYGLRNLFWILTSVCAFASVPLPVVAQSPSTSSASSHAKAITQLIEAADSLPFEFRADIQLSAAEAGELPREKASQEILESLFEFANTSKYGYRLKTAFPTSDTVENNLASALATLSDLDALSIKTRAILSLAKMDRSQALQELRRVHLHIPPTGCKSSLVPDVSSYYGHLEALAMATFPTDHKSKNDDILWYEDNIRAIGSAVELVPAADFLLRISVTPEQFDRLSSIYAMILQSVRATDREMGFLESDHSLTKAIRNLASARQQRKLSAEFLLNNYRVFLIHSSEETSCADLTADWTAITKTFNEILVQTDSLESVRELDFRELRRPASEGERAEMRILPKSDDFYRLLEKIYALREKEGSHVNPLQQQADTKAWESDIAAFLNKIDGYDPSKAACVECAYIDKTRLLTTFFDFCPTSSYKQKILDRLIAVLATSPLQSESPVQWLLEMKILLNLSRPSSEEQSAKVSQLQKGGFLLILLPSSMSQEIREGMKHSGNFTMYVYVNSDGVLGTKFFLPYLGEN